MIIKLSALIAATLVFSGRTTVAAQASSGPQVIKLAVTQKGFEPSSIDVKPGSDVVLKVTRKTDATCAKKINVPSKNISIDLKELNKEYSAKLGRLEKGELRFACGMDMLSGIVSIN